jgi:uncharacterized protein YycO
MKILLVKNKGLVSSLIEFQTRSIYSHAAILDGGDVWEAVSPKVRKTSYLEFKDNYHEATWDTFKLKPQYQSYLDEAIMRGFLDRQVGKGYSYSLVVKFITRQDASRNDCGHWFCSELAFAAWVKGGVHLLANIPAWKVYPSELSYSPLLDIE